MHIKAESLQRFPCKLDIILGPYGWILGERGRPRQWKSRLVAQALPELGSCWWVRTAGEGRSVAKSLLSPNPPILRG